MRYERNVEYDDADLNRFVSMLAEQLLKFSGLSVVPSGPSGEWSAMALDVRCGRRRCSVFHDQGELYVSRRGAVLNMPAGKPSELAYFVCGVLSWRWSARASSTVRS